MKRQTQIRNLILAAMVSISALSNALAFERVAFLRQDGNAIILKAEAGRLRLSVITPDIIRVQATTNTSFKPALMVKAGFVKSEQPKGKFDLADTQAMLSITTAALKVQITKRPFRLELFSAGGQSLFKTTDSGGMQLDKGTTLNLEMTPDDHFFGFGYMRKCFDARGHTLTWTRTYRNNEATVPFFLNPRGYAFLSINTWKNDFDFTQNDTFRITTAGGNLDFFLMVGEDFKHLLGLYTDLTGKPQMAPKWALGLEHRARYYDDAKAVLNSARLFRQHNIPCEIMALEPGWEERPYSMEWKWSAKRFPDPVGMIRELKRMGYQFDLWESGAAPKQDLLNSKVRQAWFAKRAAALTNWGVDMFKQDDPYPRGIKSVGMEPAIQSDGEVSDRHYAPGEIITVANSFYTQTAFVQWRKLTKRRPVIQFHAYNASIASQRWPYQWAGDFGTGWGLFNASLSGHAMANADARSPYLDARHLDFFMSAGPVNDCWAYTIEPWNYSDRLLEGCRMYASLRARLYPYLYTAMRISHETGVPIMRPMVLNNPHDPATYKIGSQFFLGDSLLVATSVGLDQYGDHARLNVQEKVPREAERTTPVYLPRGRWIDYWTGREYAMASNQWTNCSFPSWTGGPLLVQEGAIIPQTQVKHHTRQWPDELLTLDIYPSSILTTQRLYEDDGITFGYEQGEFANTTFSSVQTGNTIRVNLGKREGHYPGKPLRRDYLLKVHSPLAPETVRIDGRELNSATKDALLFTREASGWYYDAAASKIIIKPHAGWHYVASGKNPAGTYPLTPAEETVVFTRKEDHSAAASRVVIILNPDRNARVGVPRQILFEPENTRVLADGHSQVRIAVMICDANDNVVTTANESLALSLAGGGEMVDHVNLERGRGEVIYTAPSQPGQAQLAATGQGLSCSPLQLEAATGALQMVVNPRTKVAIPGKGEWLAARFTIAVSARDAAGNRLATQAPVKLVIRDYKDRETIERTAVMINGEAEFRNVAYRTRPEKFIITATADGLETATLKAFENCWHLPDDYLTNKSIKDGLEKVLEH